MGDPTANKYVKNDNRYCFVPMCKNTGRNSRDKIFVNVPLKESLRKKWMKAARRDERYIPSSKSRLQCCEDHFKLEEDAENWMYYKMMGGPLRLKKGVIPHIFECQYRDTPKKIRPLTRKKRKQEIMDLLASFEILKDEEREPQHPIPMLKVNNKKEPQDMIINIKKEPQDTIINIKKEPPDITINMEPQDMIIKTEIEADCLLKEREITSVNECKFEKTEMYVKDFEEEREAYECDPLAIKNDVDCEKFEIKVETVAVKEEPECIYNNYLHTEYFVKEEPDYIYDNYLHTENVNFNEDTEDGELKHTINNENTLQTRETEKHVNKSNVSKTTRKKDVSFKSSDISRPKRIKVNHPTLEIGLHNLKSMGDSLQLPKFVIEQASDLLRQVYERKIFKYKYRLLSAVPPSCLYIACRQGYIPRTFKEVAVLTGVNKADIGRCFRQILKDLDITLDHITVDNFISQLCSRLGYPDEVQESATRFANMGMDILEKIKSSPISLAAAAIFFAGQTEPNIQNLLKDVGDLTGVSESTIKRILMLLIPYM